jgi:hypothetical protein
MTFWTIYLILGCLTGALFVSRANHANTGKMIAATAIVVLFWWVWLALTAYWTVKFFMEARKE